MTEKELKKSVTAYLSKIGTKGGKKSRRKMSKEEAKRIAQIRWKKKAS